MRIPPALLAPCAAFVLVIASPLRAAEPVAAESRITAATVYPDRAVVSRLAAATKLPAGATEITFSGLPAALLDDSVQVSARGPVAASLLDVAVRLVFTEAQPDARVKELEDKLLDLRREERALKDQASVLKSQTGLVGEIEKASTTVAAPAPGAAAPARPGLDDYEKLLAFSASQRARLHDAARKLEIEQTALAGKISAVESQLGELRGKQPATRATKTVTVRLDVAAAAALDLSLSYAVPAASWTPAYDARLRSEKRQVQLDAFGLVRNSTGEDWTDIALTLSTARPGLGGAAPEIAPWHVDVVRPVAMSKMARGSMAFDRTVGGVAASSLSFGNETMTQAGAFNGAMMAADGFAAPATPPPEFAAALASASVESAATSASFKIATPVTLASDNTSRRVPVGSAAFPAELQYQATPKLQETAYLAAYVTNRSELPFLGGALNVFLDETFVAASRLATTMPGEKFTLNLGADEGISIKRKVVSRFTEDTGLATKSRRTTYDILVTVTNHKKTAERVVLKDALPVARDEKILVRQLAPSEKELLKPEDAAAQPPKVGIARDAEGKLTWRFDLKPGEKREFPFKFSIEHPADLAVSGVE